MFNKNKRKLTIIILIISFFALLFTLSGGLFSRQFGKKFEIPAKEGEDGMIKVNDFRKGSEKLLYGMYFLDENQNYTITYYVPGNLFGITINNSEVKKTRSRLEKDLLKILGITKSDACKLKVSMFVPAYVNEQYAGTNYGLSFCPDGIPFDQTVSGGQAENSSASQSLSLLQKLINIFKNPLTVALGAALIIVAGIVLFARR
ncbi:MAG: hypothetical protein WC745_00065 [Patescibacteria group bacterium]|jgi:hypothetical protein